MVPPIRFKAHSDGIEGTSDDFIRKLGDKLLLQSKWKYKEEKQDRGHAETGRGDVLNYGVRFMKTDETRQGEIRMSSMSSITYHMTLEAN